MTTLSLKINKDWMRTGSDFKPRTNFLSMKNWLSLRVRTLIKCLCFGTGLYSSQDSIRVRLQLGSLLYFGNMIIEYNLDFTTNFWKFSKICPLSFLASSLTAMETWVVACLVFVFLALIEYGIVLKMTSKMDGK